MCLVQCVPPTFISSRKPSFYQCLKYKSTLKYLERFSLSSCCRILLHPNPSSKFSLSMSRSGSPVKCWWTPIYVTLSPHLEHHWELNKFWIAFFTHVSSLSDINVFLFYLDIDIFYLLIFFYKESLSRHRTTQIPPLHIPFRRSYYLKMDLGKPKESMNIFYFFCKYFSPSTRLPVSLITRIWCYLHL